MEELIAADAKLIARAKIRQARAMSPEMKFRAGGDLFEESCRWSLAGIAAQFPSWMRRDALPNCAAALLERSEYEVG